MAKYVEAGVTTRFFNWFIGIDKPPDLAQPIVELIDGQNDINLVPGLATDDLDHVTDSDELIQEAIVDDEDFMESHQASKSVPGKENRRPITFDNKKSTEKKPFQMKGRLRRHGVSRFKPLNRNDSRHFSF